MLDNKDVHRLEYNGKEIILLGTAHVSQKSVDLVREIIEEEKPDTVCVELCNSRYETLTKKQQWEDSNLIKVIKEKKAPVLLANLMLQSIQRKIGKKLGIKPGAEMIQAIDSSKITGSEIYCADREIRTTLSRAWNSITLWEKVKLMSQFVASIFGLDEINEEEVEELKNKDMLESLLTEIGEAQPQLKKILIDERDLYLTEKIRNAPGDKIVAVVGAGHVPGIKAGWKNDVNIEELEEKPQKGNVGTILKWGLPVIIIGLITAGFINSGAEEGTEMIRFWFVANIVLAGIGAAAALGHPVTIIVAAVSSPITSLIPVIGAGWVAAIVQIFISKPKVRDFEALSDDILTIRGFWGNKITKVLLVFMFTQLGSSAGALVSYFVLGKNLKTIAILLLATLILTAVLGSASSKKPKNK